MDDNCIPVLCNPDSLPVGEAIRLARAVSRIEPNLAGCVGAYIGHLSDAPDPDARTMQRALEVLCAVSDPRTFAATCQRAEDNGRPVTGALVRWLAAGAPRRVGRTPQARSI
ncbi:MAG: hypothetical protein ABI759_32960 [Candidatus Solibacter sp.]